MKATAPGVPYSSKSQSCSNQMWISATTTCSSVPKQIAGTVGGACSLYTLEPIRVAIAAGLDVAAPG